MNMKSHIAKGLMVALVLALSLVGATLTANAAEAVPTETPSNLAFQYMGTWLIVADFNGREIEFYLNVVDIDGQVGGTLDSVKQAEPIPIDRIWKDSAGLKFQFEMKFGDNAFTLILDVNNEEGQLTGTISDTNGLFTMEAEGARAEGGIDGKRPNPTSARMNVGMKKYKVTFKDLMTSSHDHKAFQELEDGEIFAFVGGRATKLFTGTDILFGDTQIKYGNAAPDYPGVYSLWLKKVGDEWHLVFNTDCDIWGTQHLDNADVAEIPLVLSTLDEAQENFLIQLVKNDAGDGGTLRIAWGTNEWTADFALAQ